MRVTEAVTEKADGRTLPVDPSAIVTTSPPNVGPLLPDLRQTTILFPDVTPGDTVRFTVERKSREPLFPGQFLLAQRYTVDGGAFSAHVTDRGPGRLPAADQGAGLHPRAARERRQRRLRLAPRAREHQGRDQPPTSTLIALELPRLPPARRGLTASAPGRSSS